MHVQLYDIVYGWYAAGWNVAIKTGGVLIQPPSHIKNWDLYDYVAGFKAAVYRSSLPDTWLP